MSAERPVAYVLGTFPQPSQTFIAREIRGLRHAGVPLEVFALARRGPDALEPADRAWYDRVRFTPALLGPAVLAANLRLCARAPGRYARTLGRLLRLPHRPRVLVARAPLLFMKAAWIAWTIDRTGGCRLVHAHFALAQTEVAMAVAGLLDVPFSFTAHARDIYATPSALAEKMRAARTVVTCTEYNRTYLQNLCPGLPGEHVRLVHHGVELGVQASLTRPRPGTPGSDGAPVILAAGRLVEKKGFDTLVEACGLLAARGVPFECRILGEGPLAGALRSRAAALGLSDRVALPGWARPDALLAEMAGASVFAMPSRLSTRGDRDGIPNVVLEAMACGVPVVASHVSGIPEAVRHDLTGLLVEPGQAGALAAALERLLVDRALAERLRAAARALVNTEFTLDVSSRRLAAIFAEHQGRRTESAMMS